MHFLKKIAGIIILLIPFLRLSAQQNYPPLKLSDLLNRVSAQAPSLLADSSAISVRQAIATDTKYNWLPAVKLNYQSDIGTNNNVPGAYFGFGIVPSNSGGIRPSNISNATLSNLGIASLDWEIYNFGGYKAQNKVAGSDVKVTENQYRLSKYQLQASVIEDYLQLFQFQNLLHIQEDNIKRNQQIRNSVQSLATSGIRAGVDTSIAEAELSKSRLTLIELTNKFKQTQLQLSALSGIAYQNIVADTTLMTPLHQINSQPGAELNSPLSHPLISYYQSLYQNSKEKENLVRKTYLPKIMLEGAFWGRGSSISTANQFDALNQGWGFTRTNYLVGIGISYNLTDLKRKQLKLNTQRYTSIYEDKRLQAQKVNLETSVHQADVELQTAVDRLAEIPRQLSAANAAYRQKYSLYKNGLIDLIELNIAQNLLYRAEADYATAKYSFLHAVFEKAITRNQVQSLLTALK
ncbi:outer membrane protein TolC [Pedobacter cryoconitis]|uniref:Outer membrane protein TolC n=1 Tax=Pedobacter cryoconitis TaxID=188932 RepID=A0A7W9E012_9SPHI|nr:TolC family protein [Pedobacter cryoconitis]MBB5637566.1 outer membrane protein TolC [Pedobacter cryoconitis]